MVGTTSVFLLSELPLQQLVLATSFT